MATEGEPNPEDGHEADGEQGLAEFPVLDDKDFELAFDMLAHQEDPKYYKEHHPEETYRN